MGVSYKKLWILLIEKGITKTQLREQTKISPSTFAKMGKNEYVAMDVLVKICVALSCNIGDIMDVIIGEDTNTRSSNGGK